MNPYLCLSVITIFASFYGPNLLEAQWKCSGTVINDGGGNILPDLRTQACWDGGCVEMSLLTSVNQGLFTDGM